jgi:hypothetical protein
MQYLSTFSNFKVYMGSNGRMTEKNMEENICGPVFISRDGRKP